MFTMSTFDCENDVVSDVTQTKNHSVSDQQKVTNSEANTPISTSCLTETPALLLHADCTVNESVDHTSVADLFQLMEPSQIAVLALPGCSCAPC